jgi:protease PrsW
MEDPGTQVLFYALLGGILPALLWLWFWLKEDKKRPEPRGMILLAFIAGMIAVPLVLPVEKAIYAFLGERALTVVLWAGAEEIFKYGAAFVAVLRSRYVDEPIDAIIYLITVALGFAALENAFFLFTPFLDGDIVSGLLTGNLRFMGATLLHTLSSAIVGGALALSFYKHNQVRIYYLLTGVILATTLHALFNFLIMGTTGGGLFTVFGLVWVGVVALLIFFERIKQLRPSP